LPEQKDIITIFGFPLSILIVKKMREKKDRAQDIGLKGSEKRNKGSGVQDPGLNRLLIKPVYAAFVFFVILA